MADHRQTATDTRRGYWQLLHGHVLPTLGARAMGGIDHLDVEQFIAAKLVEGLSPKKVRDTVSVVSLVMKCAVHGGGRRDNPAAEHHIPVARRKLRPGDVPDMADIERLIAQVADPYKPSWVWPPLPGRPVGGLPLQGTDRLVEGRGPSRSMRTSWRGK